MNKKYILINKSQNAISYFDKKFPITKEEYYYLRLRCHRKTIHEIKEFLNKSKNEIFSLERSLLIKLNSHNWFELVLRSFLFGILKYEEYLDDSIREEIYCFSNSICNLYDQNKSYASLYELREGVLDLLSKCDKKLKSTEEIFTSEEKEFLNLKFYHRENVLVEKEMGITSHEVIELENKIFSKMNVSDYFNCFIKGIRLGILEQTKEFALEDLISEYLMRFEKIIKSKDVFKRQLAYDELLNLYANIEFNYLLNPSYVKLFSKVR